MFAELERASKDDKRLAEHLMHARELAEIYLMARKRQKGCDGMGELSMVKEEFRDSIDNVLRYCTENNCLPDDMKYDTDSAAEALADMEMT